MRRDLLLFVVAALFQLAVPGWMIVRHERVLQRGEVFRFKTAPIDPRDPFRGEYVQLNFEAADGPWPRPGADDGDRYGATYAVLNTDSAGFARIAALQAAPPDANPYLVVEMDDQWDTTQVQRVRLPFDRYYLEEGDGAKTEDLLAPQWTGDHLSEPLPAYALVRVYAGQAVIEDLIVGDRSIHAWLKDMPSTLP